MTFVGWWSDTVFQQGEEEAEAAWDYQQKIIDSLALEASLLEAELKFYRDLEQEDK